MKVLGIDPGTSVTGYGVVEYGNGTPGFGRDEAHGAEFGSMVVAFTR